MNTISLSNVDLKLINTVLTSKSDYNILISLNTEYMDVLLQYTHCSKDIINIIDNYVDCINIKFEYVDTLKLIRVCTNNYSIRLISYSSDDWIEVYLESINDEICSTAYISSMIDEQILDSFVFNNTNKCHISIIFGRIIDTYVKYHYNISDYLYNQYVPGLMHMKSQLYLKPDDKSLFVCRINDKNKFDQMISLIKIIRDILIK